MYQFGPALPTFFHLLLPTRCFLSILRNIKQHKPTQPHPQPHPPHPQPTPTILLLISLLPYPFHYFTSPAFNPASSWRPFPSARFAQISRPQLHNNHLSITRHSDYITRDSLPALTSYLPSADPNCSTRQDRQPTRSTSALGICTALCTDHGVLP